MDAYEEALRRELEGYERSGNKARADQVRAELRRIGAEKKPAPVERAVAEPAEQATTPRPRARAAKRKTTKE